jgi:hypothetical protein
MCVKQSGCIQKGSLAQSKRQHLRLVAAGFRTVLELNPTTNNNICSWLQISRIQNGSLAQSKS